jgi:hypothetical protein
MIFVFVFKADLTSESHEIFDLWFFSSNTTPGSTDSWAKAVSNIDSYSRRYMTTKFSILFYCHRVGKIIYGLFCYTVVLTAVKKAETFVFWLRTVRKKSALWCIARSRALCNSVWNSRLRAILHSFICDSALDNSVWNSSQFFSTPRYAA